MIILAASSCSNDTTDKANTRNPTHTPSPAPSYSTNQMKTRLLKGKDVHPKAASQAPNFPGFDKAQAPMCSLTSAPLKGTADKIIQQFGSPASRFRAPNYNQIIAIYQTSTEAATAFDSLRKKIDSCPSKQHIPQKRISGNRITLQHDDTWKVTKDALAGWIHIRGFEKHVEPPSTSNINVYYFAYDYLMRGNVIFSSVYWQRARPKDSSDPIVDRATDLLAKQLKNIG